MMTSAQYGHMTVGRCITEEDQYLGCSNDALPVIDRWCSGRRECSFEVPNDDLENLNKNCLTFLKIYLELRYNCIKGMICVIYLPTIDINHEIIQIVYIMHV